MRLIPRVVRSEFPVTESADQPRGAIRSGKDPARLPYFNAYRKTLTPEDRLPCSNLPRALLRLGRWTVDPDKRFRSAALVKVVLDARSLLEAGKPRSNSNSNDQRRGQKVFGRSDSRPRFLVEEHSGVCRQTIARVILGGKPITTRQSKSVRTPGSAL
jgi:hypothetical protein